MVTLPNGDQITLVSGRPSVRILVQLLGSRGYTVEVHLFFTQRSLIDPRRGQATFILLPQCAPRDLSSGGCSGRRGSDLRFG